MFLQSNVSYQSDPSTLRGISGTLSVGVNADPHVKEGVASVTMHYTNESLKDQTSVCLMNVSNSNGLYLYVPSNISSVDSLSFNVTFLFPQAPLLYVTEFVTLLPHFDQYFASLSDWVIFDKVSLGGPRSQVSVVVSTLLHLRSQNLMSFVVNRCVSAGGADCLGGHSRQLQRNRVLGAGNCLRVCIMLLADYQ